MAETAQDKEFKSFGITGKLRGGMLMTVLGISLAVNVWAIKTLVKSADEKAELVQKVTEQATNRTVELLRPDITEVKEKVNTASDRIDTTLNKIQEITGGKK